MISQIPTGLTVVFFDGECVICNRFFRFLLKRDKRKQLKFATLQSKAAMEMINSQFILSSAPDSIFLWYNGKLYTKSNAALRAIALLGSLWAIIKLLLIIPAFIRDFVYDFVARNRYKWYPKQQCMIPEENWKDRFIL